jgi:hypothetical protein
MARDQQVLTRTDPREMRHNVPDPLLKSTACTDTWMAQHAAVVEGGSVTRVEVFSGVCGYSTAIEAVRNDNRHVKLRIESNCEAVQDLAAALREVDPFQEISFRGEGPLTLQLAQQILPHAACPVPAGIIKAVEVAGGLALPVDAFIRIAKDRGKE